MQTISQLDKKKVRLDSNSMPESGGLLVCAKNTRGSKRSTELDAVAEALSTRFLARFRKEAIDRGQTGDLREARSFFERKAELRGPTQSIRLKLDPSRYHRLASGARCDFDEWLEGLCQTVLPEQLSWLADKLCEVSSDFEWVERELERRSPDVETRILFCAEIVSNGESAGLAGWLIDWPGQMTPEAIFSSASDGCLDDFRSAKVRTSIQNRVKEALALAIKSAADHARILIANEEKWAKREKDGLLEDCVPDSAPKPIKRGRFCCQVIDEIKRIKNLVANTGRSVAEIEKEHPNFAVWKVRTTLSPEDQQTFNHPNQWGPPVGYARMILSKTQGASTHTIDSWVKACRKHQKIKAG